MNDYDLANDHEELLGFATYAMMEISAGRIEIKMPYFKAVHPDSSPNLSLPEMYPLLVAAFSILSFFVRSTNAVAFVLDPASYPEVTDHHCIAFYCSGLNFQQSPNGFHRDTSGNSDRVRRHAIGCDGVTDCHTSTTGQSCDEVRF